MGEKCYVIQFGNHWLMSDDLRTEIDWVPDLASASLHTKEWADRLKKDLLKENKSVDVYLWIDALDAKRRRRDERIRHHYYKAVYNYLQTHAPHLNEKVEGLNNPGWVFGMEGDQVKGVPATTYAQQWIKFKAKQTAGKARRRPKMRKFG